MTGFPIFLSVAIVVRNQSTNLRAIITEATETLTSLVSEYELIIVDNASDDDSVGTLKQLTSDASLPNLQVFALTKEVDTDTAAWAALENALGDFIAVWDPMTDDVKFIQTMLERSVAGSDVVFGYNEIKPREGLLYRLCLGVFTALYRWFSGINLIRDAPQFRILSKRVVNFILQHSTPVLAYRHLPATAGFARTHLTYAAEPKKPPRKRLWLSIERGIRTLISTTRAPMRLATMLSFFGAASNIVYSVYVLAVALLKQDVAPGWVTLSLQQSGMFFLISLVLLVLGEYTVHLARLSSDGPAYHVAQELTSSVITRRQKLNIEETEPEKVDAPSEAPVKKVV
jgi:glycosyltransferase involved in cell wall biosynthesis